MILSHSSLVLEACFSKKLQFYFSVCLKNPKLSKEAETNIEQDWKWISVLTASILGIAALELAIWHICENGEIREKLGKSQKK